MIERLARSLATVGVAAACGGCAVNTCPKAQFATPTTKWLSTDDTTTVVVRWPATPGDSHADSFYAGTVFGIFGVFPIWNHAGSLQASGAFTGTREFTVQTPRAVPDAPKPLGSVPDHLEFILGFPDGDCRARSMPEYQTVTLVLDLDHTNQTATARFGEVTIDGHATCSRN